MINTLKLKGRIAEKGKTIQKLAPIAGCSAYTLGRKIANEAPMTKEEAMILCEELQICNNEFADFFLQNELQNTTNERRVKENEKFVNFINKKRCPRINWLVPKKS